MREIEQRFKTIFDRLDRIDTELERVIEWLKNIEEQISEEK